MMEEKAPFRATSPGNDNTTAIIAYLTLIGFIVAIVLHSQRHTLLGAYHLRQMMGLLLLAIGVSFIPFVNIFAWVFFVVLWVFGLMNAINGRKKPIPLLGEHFETWFKGAFN